MSDYTNNKLITQRSATEKPLEPESVTRDAGELMEDLFSDIDRVLEKDNNLANQPTSQESVSLSSIRVRKPSSLQPLQQEEKENTFQPNNLIFPQDSRSFATYFDTIVFLVACICLVGSIFLFLHRDKLVQHVEKPVSTPDKQLSESDAQFIAYVQRTLEKIDRKQQAKEEVATAVNPPPSTVNSSPPPTTPATPATPAPIQTPKVIERKVYIPIPVYRPTPKETVAAIPTKNPTETPLEEKDTRPLPTPDVVTLPSPSPSPTAPSPQAVATPPPPPQRSPSPPAPSPQAVPEALAPSPTVEVAPDLANIPPTPEPSPSVTGAFIGFFEFGDRSVALFDINGNTERISLGEEIGSTGWILDSVASGKVTIRRNGNLRSLYPGQNF